MVIIACNNGRKSHISPSLYNAPFSEAESQRNFVFLLDHSLGWFLGTLYPAAGVLSKAFCPTLIPLIESRKITRNYWTANSPFYNATPDKPACLIIKLVLDLLLILYLSIAQSIYLPILSWQCILHTIRSSKSTQRYNRGLSDAPPWLTVVSFLWAQNSSCPTFPPYLSREKTTRKCPQEATTPWVPLHSCLSLITDAFMIELMRL